MIRFLVILSALSLGVNSLTMSVKDIVRLPSQRSNQLLGYGLVVGLPGTGDSRSRLGQEALKKVLGYRGISLPDQKDLNSRNIAAVMVLGKMPAITQSGQTIDIWVSSIGDAKSLHGGVLLQTPLQAADGKIYAVAQGSLSAHLSYEKNSDKRVGTVHVPDAALIEKPVSASLFETRSSVRYLDMVLLHQDIITQRNLVSAVNGAFPGVASISENGIISVKVPDNVDPSAYAASIMELQVDVSHRARVVIDTRSGTVVMGGSVGLSAVSVTKSGINIEIKEKGGGSSRKEQSTVALSESPTVAELVNGLNKLGLTAQDIVDILRAIHAAGALHGELEVI